MQKFEDLLEKYLANKATPEDVAEFLRLVREGMHEALLERLMDERFGNQYQGLQPEVRIEVIEHIVSHQRRRKYARRYLVAAAVVAVLAVAGLWLYQSAAVFLRGPDLAGHGEFLSVSDQEYVSLPDGSTVILKHGGKLRYRESFSSESRELTLTGEAFFDVVHDPTRPFVVRTGAISTTVLGTEFSINAGDVGQVTVTVRLGKVSVGDDMHAEVISHDEQVVVKPSTREFFRTSVNADSLLQWVNNYFILDRVTMEEAAELIGRRFNVQVIIANDNLKECEITAWFLNNEDLEQVIEAISAVRQATTTTNDGKVIIDGGIGCSPEPRKENQDEDQ